MEQLAELQEKCVYEYNDPFLIYDFTLRKKSAKITANKNKQFLAKKMMLRRKWEKEKARKIERQATLS